MPTLVELRDASYVEVSKYRSEDDRTAGRTRRLAGSAVQGAGATTAGLGLIASGVPGYKPDLKAAPWKSAHTGVFGWRRAAHAKARRKMRNEIANAGHREGMEAEFKHARKKGKIPAETKVIRQDLTRGHKLGRKALYGGLAVTAAGSALKKPNSWWRQQTGGPVEKADRVVRDPRDYQGRAERKGAAYIGAGATGAAAGFGGSKVLERKGREWDANAKAKLVSAERDLPGLKGRKKPVKSNDWLGPDTWKGVTDDLPGWNRVRSAGRKHGAASQSRYFANTYRKNAKWMKAGGGVGAGVAGYGALKMMRNRPYQSPKQ